MQPKPLPILEKLLQLWEDYMLFRGVVKILHENYAQYPARESEPYPQNDAATHYRGFRSYLQNAFTKESCFDKARFISRDPEDGNADSMNVIASTMFSWVKNSRRVFSLAPDLQLLLDATSIEGITWGDIRLPFETFLVELAIPFENDQGELMHYALIDSVEDESGENKIISLLTLHDSLLTHEAISLKEKSNLAKFIRQKNWPKLILTIETIYQRMRGMKLWGSSLITKVLTKDTPVDESFAANEASLPWDFAALRVVVGMCMYMKTLPSSSPHISAWHPLPKTPTIRGNSVSNGASICSVDSSFKLTNEEKVAFANPANKPTPTFGEKCCHFRRGTWCRPSGSDLNAEKTIWRRPTIVRKDKLLPGELPKGAESILFGS